MIAEILKSLKVINQHVSDGALKKVGDRKILDPLNFEFSTLPDDWQAIVTAEYTNVQEAGWLLVDDAGQPVPGVKPILEKEGFKLEKVSLGGGKCEFVIRTPKYDMILVT
jgi:hypothetical protein